MLTIAHRKQETKFLNPDHIHIYSGSYNFIFLPLIITGDKRKRDEDSDLDHSCEKHILGKSDSISPSLPKKQKGMCYIATKC